MTFAAVFGAAAVLMFSGCITAVFLDSSPHHHDHHHHHHQENLHLRQFHQPLQQHQQHQKEQHLQHQHQHQQYLQGQRFQHSFQQQDIIQHHHHQQSFQQQDTIQLQHPQQQPNLLQQHQQQKQQQIPRQQQVTGTGGSEERKTAKEEERDEPESAMMRSKERRDRMEMMMGGGGGEKKEGMGGEGEEAEKSGSRMKREEGKMRREMRSEVEMAMEGEGDDDGKWRGKRNALRGEGGEEMMMRHEGANVIWEGGSELVIVQRPPRMRREEDNVVIREDSHDDGVRGEAEGRGLGGGGEEGNAIREEGDEDEMRYGEERQGETTRDSCQPREEVVLVTEVLADLTRSIKALVDKTAASAPCPNPFTRIGGECFYPHPKKLRWGDARRVCQGMGGDLAVPTHLYSLQAHLAQVFGPSYFWVGGTDQESEGRWRWVSGEPLDPSDWLFSRPDNRNGNEHCLEMVMSDFPGIFNDETCDVEQRFICQLRERW